jgi:hypothetical protein
VGVLRCNTLIVGIALCTGCLQGKDTVLQPDQSDSEKAGSTGQNMQGMSTAGTKAPQTSGMSTGGNKSPSSAAGSGTGTMGTAGQGPTGMQPVDAGEDGYENMGAAGSAGSTPSGMAGSGSMGDAGMMPMPTDAGPGETPGAADPECDFNGIWIANQQTVSEALSLPQTSNNWYYLELEQSGNDVEVSKHFDCGIEVRGSATVVLSRATLTASITRNLQAGRKINVSKQGTSCSFEAARFWSIRGADELRFLPGEPNPGRDFPDNISDVAKSKPLPTASMTDGAVDIDNDGKLGIAFQVTGIVMGTRNSVQRDWTRWFTEPGYEIAASQDWTSDLTVRADFDNEESIIDPTSGLLVSGSMPSGTAKHVLTLRFLGRDASDPRAAALIKADDVDTCYAIQDALPAGTL